MPEPLRESGGRELSEYWYHLLSDVRRIRRRRDGAWHRLGEPWTRSPFHHLQTAVPASILSSQNLLSRSRRRPLPVVRVSAVRPRPRGANARGRQDSRTRASPLSLRDSARDQRL